MKLTKNQKLQIYCVKHGHAKYVTQCFGDIYCGRCENKLGDTLAGAFSLDDFLIIGHKCAVCEKISSRLSRMDTAILLKLEKARETKRLKK